MGRRPGKVVTNAHVVAGMRAASVQVGGIGREYAAQSSSSTRSGTSPCSTCPA